MCRHTTFSVVFFCKKTKLNKKGKAPIYARITTSGNITEIYTQCQIEPKHWSQRLEQSTLRDSVSLQINEIITTYRTNILAAYDSIIKEGREPNCFAIKQRLENRSGNRRMFLAEFSKYCDKRQKEVRYVTDAASDGVTVHHKERIITDINTTPYAEYTV